MNKQLTKKDFFFCYNRKMMVYLKSKGISFLLCAKHEVSNCQFWMFEKSLELDIALASYDGFKK